MDLRVRFKDHQELQAPLPDCQELELLKQQDKEVKADPEDHQVTKEPEVSCHQEGHPTGQEEPGEIQQEEHRLPLHQGMESMRPFGEITRAPQPGTLRTGASKPK